MTRIKYKRLPQEPLTPFNDSNPSKWNLLRKSCLKNYFIIFLLLIILLVSLTIIASQIRQYNTNIKQIFSKKLWLYKRHPKTKNLSCLAYFDNSKKGKTITANEAKNRIFFNDPKENEFKTDCESIKNRGYFPEKPLSDEEANFPLAFARIVYKDYVFIETVFRADFAQQNTFCYVIDVKVDELFKKRMNDLKSCFSKNVYISDAKLSFESNGKNMNLGYLSCLEKIRHRNYRYVFYLQNYDFKLKTNRQMVEILSRFHGANDISATPPVEHSYPKANYTLAALKIFKNVSKNLLKNSKNQLVSLQIVKSLVEVTLSKSAADYILDELNVTNFIKTLEQANYGMDEDFMGTLNANDVIGLPGGYTLRCLNQKFYYYFYSRYSDWQNSNRCQSGFWRHSLCIFGVEDLSKFKNVLHFIGNKFQQTFDFGAVDCYAEKLFNMTYLETFQHLNYSVYENSPVVRYNKLRNSGGNMSKFVCEVGKN